MTHFPRSRLIQSALCIALAGATGHAELCLSLAGSGGYFILPAKVSGYVDQYTYAYGDWDAPEPYVTGSGYGQTAYRFEHAFGKPVAPNVGCALGLSYFFKTGFGFGQEFAYGFSVRDLVNTSTTSDSLGPDAYSIIPHDYRTVTVESGDRMRVKSWSIGMVLGKRWQVRQRLDISASVGIGKVEYLAWFQTENNQTATGYYQSNGHQVYQETADGEFTVFGIRYPALYLKPSLGCSYQVSALTSLNADVKVPLSYIDKGYDWTEGDGTSHSAIFYPSERFIAGNVSLNLGATLHFGARSGS